VASDANLGAPEVPRPAGRRYGFLCQYCSSRLEATESMAAQAGTCPTCGNTIIIPILDHRGRPIDPTTNQIIRQDPHPVHAYAAAGHRAPQIIEDAGAPEGRVILCPRCNKTNPISANNCASCGLPFTMEGTVGDAVSGTNTWAVASLVMGIVSMAGGCLLVGVPPILAVIFGIISLRSMGQSGGTQAGHGLALAGIMMGVIGLILFGLIVVVAIH
jgi:predicted RNA-binding Zn-ribbon protein involved in translation (DUF1610 family)